MKNRFYMKEFQYHDGECYPVTCTYSSSVCVLKVSSQAMKPIR